MIDYLCVFIDIVLYKRRAADLDLTKTFQFYRSMISKIQHPFYSLRLLFIS